MRIIANKMMMTVLGVCTSIHTITVFFFFLVMLRGATLGYVLRNVPGLWDDMECRSTS